MPLFPRLSALRMVPKAASFPPQSGGLWRDTHHIVSMDLRETGMTISVGETFPNVTVKTWDDAPVDLSVGDLIAGKTVVIFGVPGAFTPTCSMRHLPGFVDHYEAIRAKGVDIIAVHSVNDPYVLNTWNKDQGHEGIETLADWDATLAKALGVDADMSKTGLGTRAVRYAAIVRDGEVTYFETGGLEVSGA
ncbi:MAG: peroxiredoxin, partial [Rhodospirillaceae bacterium]